jgi:hypothetical protein
LAEEYKVFLFRVNASKQIFYANGCHPLLGFAVPALGDGDFKKSARLQHPVAQKCHRVLQSRKKIFSPPLHGKKRREEGAGGSGKGWKMHLAI